MEIELTTKLVVFLVGVGLYTLAAAFTDLRSRRIPNPLTVTAFGLGLLYQVVFNGLPGLGDGLLGFLVGFGLLFVLWMVGGGGGGDVKLMGGLSVWLGFRLTLYVLIAATIVVIVVTGSVVFWSLISKGAKDTKKKYLATGKGGGKGKKKRAETVEQKQQRRVMPFAVPVALATWFIVVWQLPQIAGVEATDTPAETARTETNDQ